MGSLVFNTPEESVKNLFHTPFGKSAVFTFAQHPSIFVCDIIVYIMYQHNTVKTRIKEQVFWEFRLILFSFIGCFLQNQPESVFKVFLKNFFK